MMAITSIHIHPDFSALKRLIHDVSQACEVDRSGLDLSRFACQELGARYTNPRFHTAVISGRRDIACFARCFHRLTRIEVQLLPNQEAAHRWLAQTAPYRTLESA